MVGILALCAVGCCGNTSREAAFHDGVKQYAVESGLLDEYDKYVDADPAIKDSTKVIRKNTSKGLRALIAEEQKALKE
jgi:hypothetical protein